MLSAAATPTLRSRRTDGSAAAADGGASTGEIMSIGGFLRSSGPNHIVGTRPAASMATATESASAFGQGWKNPGFELKKYQPSGFFRFFYLFAQKREILGFFQFQE